MNNVKICVRWSVACMQCQALSQIYDCESISLLSRYQDKANKNLIKAWKRILRYVIGTLNKKLGF